MNWQPYPAYKDPGVEWLGEIPEHWQMIRLKFVAAVNMGQSPSSDDCNLNGEGPPFLQGNAEFGSRHPTPKQYCPVANKHAATGDLLLSVRAPVGALNIADQFYGIGRGLCAITPANKHLDREYVWYLLQVTRTELDVEATGSTYDAVSTDEVANMRCTIPPLFEQRAIAAFLDRETARLDALVARQERLIELLQEKRAALISHAVTKGLNPTVPMKDSGIPWLGEIPAHWEVQRLKNVLQGGLVNGLFKKKDQYGSGTKLVNVVDLYQNDFLIDFDSLDRIEADAQELQRYSVQSGDIFFVRSSLKLEGVAASACMIDIPEPTVFECHLVRVRPSQDRMQPKYLINYLNSSLVRQRLVSLAKTTTMTTISQPQLATLEVIVPPLEEQQAIATHLDRETAKIDALIAKVRETIERLREYRTALISAAVTGKIDVRQEVVVNV